MAADFESCFTSRKRRVGHVEQRNGCVRGTRQDHAHITSPYRRSCRRHTWTPTEFRQLDSKARSTSSSPMGDIAAAVQWRQESVNRYIREPRRRLHTRSNELPRGNTLKSGGARFAEPSSSPVESSSWLTMEIHQHLPINPSHPGWVSRAGESVAAQCLWQRYHAHLGQLASRKPRNLPRCVADKEDVALVVAPAS